MIVLRGKNYSVYDGNEFWEELIGKKIPKQLYTLTEIEKRYPKIREIVSDGSVPMSPGDHKLDIFNDDLLVKDDEYLLLVATPDGISGGDLLWYFKKDIYIWDGSRDNMSFRSIRDAMIYKMNYLIDLVKGDISGVTKSIDAGQEHSRKGFSAFILGKGYNLREYRAELESRVALYQDYREYLRKYLR